MKLETIRHSMAHVCAQAVKELYPEAKLGFGPATEDGFFYDFDFGSKTIEKKDLKNIEKKMKKLISAGLVFEKKAFGSAGEALSFLGSYGVEPYKKETIEKLSTEGAKEFSFYSNERFSDLCEGPHVENTKELNAKAFKLDRIAGAYWLGSEKNPMLTRIYAFCFETEDDLKTYLKKREIAEKYDHKKLNKELDLYTFSDLVGKGLPLWLPNGYEIRQQIENFATQLERAYGYKRVWTPHITKSELYHKSGHLPAYEDSMFPPMHDEASGEDYYLKPMNCPHHHLIYSHKPVSYRELPVRLAEYGTNYRFERSGELSGLLRVRAMTLNDAHIYLREDQFLDEFSQILKMYAEFYDAFQLEGLYKCRLSLRALNSGDFEEKYKGESKMWQRAEDLLKEAMESSGLDYYTGYDEAAFYGPKIDFQFQNLLGREETASTIQVDFLSPQNFDLNYTGSDGEKKRPIIIHRSPLSTHERMISLLTEYYGGAFPLWCCPIQVCIVAVSEKYEDYAKTIFENLKKLGLRVELDLSSESLSKKVRVHTKKKIPHLLILGEKESSTASVSLRKYSDAEQYEMDFEEYKKELLSDIASKKALVKPMFFYDIDKPGGSL